MAALAAEAGLERIHVLAWRDLVDIEAGGSELHAAKILAIWAEAGLDITMRTSYAQGHPFEGTRDGYRIIRKHGRFMVFPTSVISELLGAHGPRDGIVEIWNGVPFLTPLWARGPKIAFMHHVHRDMWDMVLEDKLASAGKFFEHRLAPPLYRRTPIVTLSESSRREMIDYLGLKPGRISVVPPGIEERFAPGDEEESPEPLLVSVGRLMPSKRFDVLLDVAAEVRRSVPDLQLVIVGDGYERPALEEQIAALDATEWVRLAGRVSDEELVSLYRRAWAVTSASIAEGWGMTLTEAAACGTPAVATDIAGHRDSVAAGLSGLLAPDPRRLVEDLIAVLTDAELRQRLSQGALEHAATFTWEATALGAFTPLALDAMRRARGRGRGATLR
ncbi:glycosyltransferase family 4 protein [Rhabdothermincola salaria]|uniref:glycosyltransferase family 4 protein n=1 Tax=Rhabdothermincola salaria TaxID=2903142 RepID=UPI001E62313C|nr:glycosyltransferase family 4 protein [Rhabdothermincola salaria]